MQRDSFPIQGERMKRLFLPLLAAAILGVCHAALSQTMGQAAPQVVDIPTRPGVTQRFVYLAPDQPKAAVVLLAGGHGGLQISGSDSFKWGKGNFLVRSRQLFASQGLAVAVVDAPSDRQGPPFLGGFRQTDQHVADIKAVIGWLKQSTLPVWLVGTSRGAQSAAYIATQLGVAAGGPDGLVLTSTILADKSSRAVPEMPLDRLAIPVLAVHHEQDACKVSAYSQISYLMNKLAVIPTKELVIMKGGSSSGDPCEAFAYHGFNGLEHDVVAKIAAWIQSH
jgi:pimeloyl-ACP methyl ester carboxylesterase